MAGHRERLPVAVNSLRQGSVLDVLQQQATSAATVAAVDKPAEAHCMLNC